MDRIRRFQRTMILSLTALNSFVYGVSMDFSLTEIFGLTIITTAIAASAILCVAQFKKSKLKRKAITKDHS